MAFVVVTGTDTGCDDTARDAEDGALLARATGQSSPRRALRRFVAPLAPAMAADEAIHLRDLVAEIESSEVGTNFALIEGAGGLLSPIDWDWNVIDLAPLAPERKSIGPVATASRSRGSSSITRIRVKCGALSRWRGLTTLDQRRRNMGPGRVELPTSRSSGRLRERLG
jgi:hypothetical protein